MTGQATWTYWVSFGYRGGFGSQAVEADLPLTTPARVRALHSRLAADGLMDPVVVSWQLLSGPEDALALPEPRLPEPRLPADRAALVTGLRELAAVLEAYPEAPAPAHISAVWYAPEAMSEHEAVAAVDAAAAAADCGAFGGLAGGHYATNHRDFGPVTYGAVYLSPEARARHAGTGEVTR